MRILLSWLKEYIDLTQTPQEIAEALTDAGIEVEGIEVITPTFTGVKAAKVMKASKHPNAERLTLAEIFDGVNTLSIVCGAPNCREGIYVALAPIGAVLHPEGMSKPALTIAKATLRGVESEGMLCSAKELGLAEESHGIIELEGVKEGELLDTKYADVAFDLSLTPNLGHAMSVQGVAKELAAMLRKECKRQPWQEVMPFVAKKNGFQVDVQAKDLCPRYSAMVISNVKVEPSPLWLKLRLERSGIRSVNSIVDVTNLVALELGQPMHAFDRSQLQGDVLKVAKSTGKEQATLLNGMSAIIPEGAIVIRDAKKIVAVGGIIGEASSAVSDTTTSIVLESAYFDAKAIRRARKTIGIMTDSSKRFERGVDPLNTVKALYYAEKLIKRLNQGAIVEDILDISSSFAAKKLPCRISRTSKILGFEVSQDEIETSLQRLGFATSFDGSDLFTVEVPPARHDIHEEIDLIEEVSKLVGVQKRAGGEGQRKKGYIGSTMPHAPLFTFSKEIRKRLLAEGLQEFVTCNLISPKMVEIVQNHPIDAASLVKVMNPMSEEQSVLRPSLLPGFLDVVKRNINQRTLNISGFEIGNVHFKNEQKQEGKYREDMLVGIVLSGEREPTHFDRQAKEVDFLDAKAIIESLVASLGIASLHFERSEVAIFHPGRQAKIISSGLQIGFIGELHPAVLRKLDIPQRVIFAECNVQNLLSLPKKHFKFEQLAEFPASERDWTITLPESVTYAEIFAAIKSLGSSLLESVELQAIFRHEKLGADRKNVTLHFVYRDRTKTVSQEEVDREHALITTKTAALLLITSHK